MFSKSSAIDCVCGKSLDSVQQRFMTNISDGTPNIPFLSNQASFKIDLIILCKKE